MGFQNSINSMLGTAGAAAALGKHISNQKETLANQEKELELKKADAKAAEISASETEKLAAETAKQAKLDLEGKNLETIASFGVDRSLAIAEHLKSQGIEPTNEAVADAIYQQKTAVTAEELAEAGHNLESMKRPSQKAKDRLAMAQKAQSSLNDEIEARRALKFDKDKAIAKHKQAVADLRAARVRLGGFE